MKTKVVIFTTNNARILVNPKETDVLRKRPNCFVDPNLDFVEDAPPEHWKPVVGDHIPVSDSKRIAEILGKLVDKNKGKDISREQVLYFTLKKHFERALQDSSEACFKIAELLRLAQGVSRKDIADKVRKDLIINYNDESLLPENAYYEKMINNFEKSLIIPMDDEEKQVRTKQIKRFGADNAVNIYLKRNYKKVFIIGAIIITAVSLLLWRLL